MSQKRKFVGKEIGQHQSSSAKPGDKINVSSAGEQNDREWFERPDHPLLIDLVFRKIFDDARGNDWKTYRLVCRRWNILSIPFTRSRLQVTISGTRSHSDSENVTSIENFMKLMNSNILGIPFGRYQLVSFDTTEGFGQEFVQMCGNTTKELILSDIDAYTIESISELLRSMPKLESFTMPSRISSKDGSAIQLFPGTKPKLSSLKLLTVEFDEAEERRRICPTLYEELLEAAPNISTVKLVSGFRDDAGFEVLECLEKLGRESSVRGLRLQSIDEKIFGLLQKMGTKGMKLKELHFVADSVHNNFNWLELVTLFKDSLISLNIRDESRTRIPIIFPTMPKLITLDYLLMHWSINLSCEDFTDTFPALKELRLYIRNPRNQVNNFITGYKSSTMKRLIFLHSPKMNIEIFNQILTVFPVLTRLDCHVTKEDGVEVIKKIWIHMTQLHGLHIRGYLPSSEYVDSLVTGIPIQEIEKMLASNFLGSLEKTTTKIQRETILKEMVMNKNFKLPSIGNLTKLRSLSIDLKANGSDIRKPNYLTDLTAYFGLYSIKNLRHLYVSQSEFSKRCCEILVEDMDLITWSFESRYYHDLNIGQIIPENLNPNRTFVYQ